MRVGSCRGHAQRSGRRTDRGAMAVETALVICFLGIPLLAGIANLIRLTEDR